MSKRQPRSYYSPSEKASPKIERFLQEIDSTELLYPTGFKDCIVGTVERIGMPECILLDKDLVIKKLMKDMTRDEAVEFYEYNILGSHMGEGTPAFATLIK